MRWIIYVSAVDRYRKILKILFVVAKHRRRKKGGGGGGRGGGGQGASPLII